MAQLESPPNARPQRARDDDDTHAAEGESPGDASIIAIRDAWRQGTHAASVAKMPERKASFTTWSGIDVPDVMTPADVAIDYARDLGMPGEYPFTRGVQPTMYRSKLWTMRMFAGFGTPEQTNERFKFLLAEGQTGLSTAFDFPTLMGYDSDSPRSLGEVGMCGVAVDTLRDMEVLYRDIPLEKVTTSMTINGPAIVLLCFYVALADVRGIPRSQIGGTVQNDCLKEFIAQHAWVVGPRPAMRIVTDMIEFCSREVPRWNSVSISGYHIREAGATASQELAFTLADGLAYVTSCLERGLKVDDFAPRLSFFFDVHNDFFEEIAKFRAARRLWARYMKERFGAEKAESLKLRTHAQTAGVSLTAQQPYNNVVRVAMQALAPLEHLAGPELGVEAIAELHRAHRRDGGDGVRRREGVSAARDRRLELPLSAPGRRRRAGDGGGQSLRGRRSEARECHSPSPNRRERAKDADRESAQGEGRA